MFSSFSEPKRKITGEILLESLKPSPVIYEDPEVHPNSQINQKPQKKEYQKISRKKDCPNFKERSSLSICFNYILQKQTMTENSEEGLLYLLLFTFVLSLIHYMFK